MWKVRGERSPAYLGERTEVPSLDENMASHDEGGIIPKDHDNNDKPSKGAAKKVPSSFPHDQSSTTFGIESSLNQYYDEDYESETSSWSGNDDDNDRKRPATLMSNKPKADDGSISCRRSMMNLLRALALLAVLAAISVGMGDIASSEGKDPNEGSRHRAPPQVPTNLASICSLESILAAGGDDLACRELCEPAECCQFPSTFALSCLEGNEDVCMTYLASCQSVLDEPMMMMSRSSSSSSKEASNSLVPTAPKSLKDTCAMSRISDSVEAFTECKQQCDRATCCFQDTASCTAATNDDDDNVCHEYAPCLHLRSIQHVNSKIAPYLQLQACHNLTTLDGRTHCRIACQHALCCFQDDTSTTTTTTTSSSSCSHLSEEQDDINLFCQQYQACNVLESEHMVVATTDEIVSACKGHDGSSMSYFTHESLCEVVCERGACCFGDEDDEQQQGNNCSSVEEEEEQDAPIDCTETYAPCAFLYEQPHEQQQQSGIEGTTVDPGTSATAADVRGDNNASPVQHEDDQDDAPHGEETLILKMDVDEACAEIGDTELDDTTTTTASKNDSCKAYCIPAQCCFDASVACVNEEIRSYCHVYESCVILFEDLRTRKRIR